MSTTTSLSFENVEAAQLQEPAPLVTGVYRGVIVASRIQHSVQPETRGNPYLYIEVQLPDNGNRRLNRNYTLVPSNEGFGYFVTFIESLGEISSPLEIRKYALDDEVAAGYLGREVDVHLQVNRNRRGSGTARPWIERLVGRAA